MLTLIASACQPSFPAEYIYIYSLVYDNDGVQSTGAFNIFDCSLSKTMTNLVCNSINNNTSVQAGNSGHCCQRPFVHPSVGLVNFSLSLSCKTNCPVEYSFRSVLFPLLFVIICSSVPSDLTTFIFCTIVLRHTKTGKCYPVNNLSKSPKFVTNLTPGSTVIRELPLRQVRELPLRQVRELPLRQVREQPLRQVRDLSLRQVRELPLRQVRELPLRQIRELPLRQGKYH